MQPEMTPDEIANEIGVRQIESRVYGEGETFVMVEGKTDAVLWEEFRSRDDCTLFPAQGKDKIIAALHVFKRREVRGIAGIVDADYWLLTDAEELGTDNLLYDDRFPDMELIVLSSPALKKLLRNELYRFDVDAVHDLADILKREGLRLAVEYGYFRLLSHLRGYSLRCNSVRLEKVVDTATLALDRALVASRLSADRPGLTSADLLRQVDELRERYPPDSLQLCRGKDVVAIIAHILPSLFKAHVGDDLPPDSEFAFKARSLSIGLRSAYDSGYFKETSLFRCIRNWEENNDRFRILKADI